MQEIIEITRSEAEDEQMIRLPDRDGVMVFLKNQQPLYYIRTNSLQRLYSELTEDEPSDNPQVKKLAPILEEYDTIQSYPAQNDLTALLIKKQLLSSSLPKYQKQIRLYDQYPYLAVSFKEPPFISVKEDTTEEFLYLGPLPDRFLLLGTIETFNRIIRSPACSGNTFPCILLQEKRCPGYCLDAARYENELKDFMLDYFLQINEKLLASLREKSIVLQDNLKFAEGNVIEKDIELLERYYRYLPFFLTIKELTGSLQFDDALFTVKNGLLESATIDKQTEIFTAINNYFTDYEKKELLAVPQENFREMWTIYKNFSSHHPENIDEIYRKSLLSIKKIVSEL